MTKTRLNLSIILGFLLTSGVVYLAMHEATSNPKIFINIGALIIVLGGMLTVSLIMNPFGDLIQLARTLIWLFKVESNAALVLVKEIVQIAGKQQDEAFLLSQHLKTVQNMHLREGLELLSLGLKAEDLEKVFLLKMDAREALNTSQSGFLLTMSKLGPGLGLVGTLFGLVALFYQMGQGLGLEQIGPSMAIALCATLYGVGTSNLIFLPLSESLMHKYEKEQLHMKIISDGIQMLKDRRHPVYVREALKSYLSGKDQQELARQLSNATPLNRSKGKASA